MRAYILTTSADEYELPYFFAHRSLRKNASDFVIANLCRIAHNFVDGWKGKQIKLGNRVNANTHR
jgi:hypothetical protein